MGTYLDVPTVVYLPSSSMLPGKAPLLYRPRLIISDNTKDVSRIKDNNIRASVMIGFHNIEDRRLDPDKAACLIINTQGIPICPKQAH